MKTSFLSTDGFARKLQKLTENYEKLYWSVAWATDGQHFDNLKKHINKIEKLVIGTDSHITTPSVLKQLNDCKKVRAMPLTEKGIFHPKIYYFEKNDSAACLIGSANFTNGGTKANIETIILLKGRRDNKAFKAVKKTITEHWCNADTITKELISTYEKEYNAKKRRNENKPKKPNRKIIPKKHAAHPDLLNLTWVEYVGKMQKTSIDGRLAMISKTRKLIHSAPTFQDLSTKKRKAIAGTYNKNEPSEINNQWGWFGRMAPAMAFKGLVNKNNSQISIALEHIPIQGAINKRHFDLFITEFKKAFKDTSVQAGVATASRLLAIKRPDHFLCFNGKNKKRLSEDLGFAVSHLTDNKRAIFDNYWNYIIEPVTNSTWALSDRPTGQGGQIWDCRVAMLDAIYYDPNQA